MHLTLTLPTIQRLRFELRRAGRREIGGILVGEHVGDENFKLHEISVQQGGGSEAHFVRDPEHHKVFLNNFFARTGRNYERFNYLGEWHSHPSYPTAPSHVDIVTMQSIVENPDVGANFAILLIVRLRVLKGMELSAMLFRPHAEPSAVQLSLESDSNKQTAQRRIWNWIKNITSS